MEYAARVLAGEEELAPDYNDIQSTQRRAAELAAMAQPLDGPPLRGRPPCELDGLEGVPLDGWWGDATLIHELHMNGLSIHVDYRSRKQVREMM